MRQVIDSMDLLPREKSLNHSTWGALLRAVPTLLLTLVASAHLILSSHSARADETTGEKIENKVDEVKKDGKKHARKVNKKVRDAKCDAGKKAKGECVMDDVGDAASNAGDEISHTAKKVKNKVD